jgi:hypothetical protein
MVRVETLAILSWPKLFWVSRMSERRKHAGEGLRQEFADFLGVGGSETGEETEPWPEPVDAATLFSKASAKNLRYVVYQPNQSIAAVLWGALSWLDDHGSDFGRRFFRDSVPYRRLMRGTSAAPWSYATQSTTVKLSHVVIPHQDASQTEAVPDPRFPQSSRSCRVSHSAAR